MCQLQLSLFGVPVVKHGETTLTFSTRKALALLVYLAVEGGLHTRKTLSESFWAELDAKHGRAALRAALLELRRLFERLHEASERAHLRIERDTLGIEQDDSLVLDLRLVESASKLVERGIASLAGQAREELLQQLEQAAHLVRGPFLAGFTLRDSQFFDDWSTQHREYWHLRVSQVFDALSLLYEQGGEVERAIEIVNRWLSFDPLTEEGYRRLMQLRFSQGDRVGALRAYTTCREVLAHELELEPEPETVALAKWIRHTAPVRSVPSPSPYSSPGQPPAKLLNGPYLRRSAEFGALIDCYRRVDAGQSHLVLLQGESGMGKTRLATEFLGWAQAQGAQVLMGKALHTGRQLPYQPLIAALRHHLEQEQAPDDLVSDVWLTELARLLPELRDRSPDLPVPTRDEALGHSGLFEATARLLQAWAARRPLVLLLDDMHWADTATRDLVLYLAQSLADEGAPILLLLTLRAGAVTFPDPQSTWVMALKRTGIPLTTLRLAPFTHEETQRFVQALAWAEQQPEAGKGGASERGSARGSPSTFCELLASLAHWLYAQTRGQPFYLVETLKALLEQEMIVPALQQDGTWRLVLRSAQLAQTPTSALIPASVRELIRAQLGQLTPAAWALLVAGAVIGEGLTFERLCQVARLDEETGVQALEEVLRRGWLCEGNRAAATQAEGGYTFAGEMIRTVVYQEAGAVRQRLVQRRVAAVLQAEAHSDQDEEVRLPHPTPLDGHAPAETRARPERRVLAGAVSREMSGMRLVDQSAVGGIGTSNWPRQMSRRRRDVSICQKTPLAAWEQGAAAHAAFALPRSPPERLASAFLRRTEAERFSAHALSTIRKGASTAMNLTHLTWLAAEYHLPSLYSCRIPMSSMNSVQARAAPGPATVRLALIRTGIEVFGLEYIRDELFPYIRTMEIRIRPPERVALTPQVLHAFKVDEQAGGTQYSTAPISREVAHASGPLTIYIGVSLQETTRWTAMLRAIDYWGQSSSLTSCIGVYEGSPDPKECVTSLRNWKSHGPLEPFFSSILSEFRDGALSWDQVMPVVGAQKVETLKLDIYVWPLVISEQHGRGKLLLRRAFA